MVWKMIPGDLYILLYCEKREKNSSIGSILWCSHMHTPSKGALRKWKFNQKLKTWGPSKYNADNKQKLKCGNSLKSFQQTNEMGHSIW